MGHLEIKLHFLYETFEIITNKIPSIIRFDNNQIQCVNFTNYLDVFDILFGININDSHEVLNFCILNITYYIHKLWLFHTRCQ